MPLQNDGPESSTFAATFTGTANPTPMNPPDCVRMLLTMPTTSPCRLNIGPPELPVLIAASVCTTCIGTPLTTPSISSRPLTWPTVRLWLSPNGAPTTTISSPTSSWSESPSFAGETAAGSLSSCNSATSARVDEPTTWAG